MRMNTMGVNGVYNRQYNTNNNSMSRQQETNLALSNRQSNQKDVSFGLNVNLFSKTRASIKSARQTATRKVLDNLKDPGNLLGLTIAGIGLFSWHNFIVLDVTKSASSLASGIVRQLSEQVGDNCNGTKLLDTQQDIAEKVTDANSPLLGLMPYEATTTYKIRSGDGQCALDVTIGDNTFTYDASKS